MVISDINILRECMDNPNFDNRFEDTKPVNNFLDGLRGSKNMRAGIASNIGQAWTEQRRFTLQSLKDFGLGKRSMEGPILEEAVEICNDIKCQLQVSSEISLDLKVNLSVFNCLLRILVGKRLDLNKQEDLEILESITKVLKSFGPSNIKQRFGIYLRHYTGIETTMIRTLIKEFKFVFGLLDSYFEAHEATFDADNLKDYTDCYIKEIRAAKKENQTQSSFHNEAGKMNYRNTMLDLFLAGADTTATTIQHALVYLMNNPKIQMKAQQELDIVTGRSRLITMDDKNHLPYLNALILEVQRCGNTAPFSVPHCTFRDGKIGDYTVLGRTWIIPHLIAIHHDPELFEDPDDFNPERFIDGTTGKFKPSPHVIPFNIGRRQCPGLSLAKMELFLFIGTLLQQFNFELCPDAPASPNDITVNLVRAPKPFKIRISER